MRILFISANWGHGGPGGVVKDLYNIMSSLGHDCIVCYGRGSCPKSINSIRIGNRLSHCIDYALSHMFDSSGRNSYFATKRLIKIINKLKPDVVHLHNLLGYYINYPLLFRFLADKNYPVVWTIHDCWAITGHCINFERINCDKWTNICHNCPLRNDYPSSFLDRSRKNYLIKKKLFSSICNIHLVTPSFWLSNLVSQSFLNKMPLMVINNGIDMSVFKHTENNLRSLYHAENKIILLFVASVWNEMKGIKIVIELAKMLDDRYLMIVIGDKQHFKLPDNVIDIKKTSNILELVDWYSAADIFVNPTLGDNFPTVNLEALSCGTPVIASRTGGAPEAISDVCGFVVDDKTPNGFKKAIESFKIKRLDKSFRDSFETKYDKNRSFLRYEELYKKISNR